MSIQSVLRDVYENSVEGNRNLGLGERVVSTGLGLAVAAGGLRRGASLPGALMGLVGAALVARGMSGHCPVKERFGEGRMGHRDYDDSRSVGYGSYRDPDEGYDSPDREAYRAELDRH